MPNIDIFFCFSHTDNKNDDLFFLSRAIANEIELFAKAKVTSTYSQIDNLLTENSLSEKVLAEINRSSLLFVFLSPSFFSNHQCSAEIEYFLNKPTASNCEDLVIPIYYIECELLNRSFQDKYPLSKSLGDNFVDWRGFRSQEFTNQEVRGTISMIAQQAIRKLKSYYSERENKKKCSLC